MPTICRWGNSLAIRIPKSVIEASGLKAGTAATVRTLDNGCVLIVPTAGSSAALGPAKPTYKEPDLKDW
jgi:antitoxin component of MazEF toxin-antitoxin module